VGSDACWCWWNVTCWSSVQPQFAQYVLAHIAGLCPPIAVRGCNVAIRDLAVRDIALLRSRCSWTDVANVLSHVAHDLDVARLLTSQPTVLPNVPFILSGFATVQPPVTVVQPHIAAVFTDEPFVQSGVPAVLSNFPRAALTNVAEVLADFTYGFAVLSKILSDLADLLSCFACVFSCFTGVQPDITILVAVEPGPNVERNSSESLVPGIALMGLRRMSPLYRIFVFSLLLHASYYGEAFISSLFTPSSCRLALPSTIELDMALVFVQL